MRLFHSCPVRNDGNIINQAVFLLTLTMMIRLFGKLPTAFSLPASRPIAVGFSSWFQCSGALHLLILVLPCFYKCYRCPAPLFCFTLLPPGARGLPTPMLPAGKSLLASSFLLQPLSLPTAYFKMAIRLFGGEFISSFLHHSTFNVRYSVFFANR